MLTLALIVRGSRATRAIILELILDEFEQFWADYGLMPSVKEFILVAHLPNVERILHYVSDAPRSEPTGFDLNHFSEYVCSSFPVGAIPQVVEPFRHG